MKLYALALKADRHNGYGVETVIAAGVAARATEDEALGRGIRLAEERWLASDGWRNHSATCCEVPEAILDMVRPATPAPAPNSGGDSGESESESEKE